MPATPGWWKTTAQGLNLDGRAALGELDVDIAALVACAVSVYCWLTGGAQLLLQTASPLFGIVLLVAGLAAVPAWWRALR